MVRSASNIKTETMDEVDFENWQMKIDKAVDLNLEKDVNDESVEIKSEYKDAVNAKESAEIKSEYKDAVNAKDTYKVELPLDLEETRINIEKYDGNDVVPQFEENIKTEIPDFEMVLVKEEPQTFITSEQYNCSDPSDAMHSPPEIVMPKLKCDPHSSCEEAENSTSQNYVPGSHQAEVVSAEETRYKCEFCDKTYARRAYLNRHLKYHTGLNLYECYDCNKKYDQMYKLKRHMRSHTGEKEARCEVCGHEFTEKGSLVIHMRTHSGERPFKCDQCGSAFYLAGNLRRHIQKVHSDEKPYKCDVCDRAYKVMGTLRLHKLRHSNTRRFSCEHCVKAFFTKAQLIEHTRLHTGEKPFHCDICDRKFSNQSHWSRHLRVHTSS